MSLCYFDYLSMPTDKDIKLDFEYIKDFSSIEQFKVELLSSDMFFLDAISRTISFYLLPIIDKKEILKELSKVNAYESYIIRQYLFDVIEFGRNYDVIDATEIYQNVYEDTKDKKISIAESTACLNLDLTTLEMIDEKNYELMIYELSKIFYKYNKYLLDNCFEIEKEDEEIIMMMEEKLDNFLKRMKIDYDLREKVIISFYKYISCDDKIKKEITNYFENLDKTGKSKIFIKKNKNSD